MNRDYVKETKRYFTLPDDRTKFTNLMSEVYGSGEKIIPSFFSGPSGKKLFKEQFITWTLNQNYALLNAPELMNQYYANKFEPLDAESQMLINASIEAMKNLKAELDAQLALDVADYEKEQKTKSKPAQNPNAPAALQVSTTPGRKQTSRNRKPVQLQRLAPQERQMIDGLPSSMQAAYDGINGAALKETVPDGLLYPGDKELKGQNNSGLQLSRDEQYRFKGHTQAGACYLYAGRSGPDAAKGRLETQEPSLAGVPTALRTPNNLKQDAAYLYLSQKANSKSLLGIAGGEYAKRAGKRKGQSLAAMKADDVVIMARESGIRLITGTNMTNSRDAPLMGKFGIELIAGNNDKDLQPLVKGNNLKKYLAQLSKAVDDLQSVTHSFITSQTAFNAATAAHTHYDPFMILCGMMSGTGPLGVMGGKNLPSDQVLAGGTKSLLEGLVQLQSSISQVFNRINNDMMGLQDWGTYSILSEKNRTN
jgi:hypothetical protein